MVWLVVISVVVFLGGLVIVARDATTMSTR